MLDADKQVSLISGRDTALKGSQVSADKITATVGRDITLQSLQDTDNYKSKQTDVSGCVSFAIIGSGGSANLSVSKSKLDSKYQSVHEQTGLFAFNHGDSDSGTTSSAISNGTLDIRDPAKQQQDVATLSHDVEHANGSISPIFDKEKEQKRLRQVQLIADIGTQTVDIVRTQGELNANKAAREELARQNIDNPSSDQIHASAAYKNNGRLRRRRRLPPRRPSRNSSLARPGRR
ncbi:hemagglutinin repeat-containing protein [Pseudomonas sp. RTB3]|nr:hemagglutinin repeat-containing protein [Pseudomonas sp. RTB3]